MYIKKYGEKFPRSCIGKIFVCTKSDLSFYKKGHKYKVHDYEGWSFLLEDLTEGCMTDWNGTSAEFTEYEGQLSFNFS